MRQFDYEEKKIREQNWYTRSRDPKEGLVQRALHHPVIHSLERTRFNFTFPKQQMSAVVKRHCPETLKSLLVAPCGRGSDLPYLKDFFEEVHGIDLSPVAVEECPGEMETRVGDILKSGYPDDSFDMVASPLFFHHLLNVGFDGFLKEFKRVLKPGGGLVILEPSLWYPLNIITRPAKVLFNNPYDQVEDEGPFTPGRMLRALRRAGFQGVEFQAASFSHSKFYIPVARVMNRLTGPLLSKSPFKYFGWLVVFWAEKPA